MTDSQAMSETGWLFAVCAALALAVVYLALRLRRTDALARERALVLEESRRQEALGTLAGGIAHDFNNILGSIMGFGALLEEDLLAHPSQQELARQVNIAAKRGQAIVMQLMNYSRKGLEDDRSIRIPRALDDIIRESIGIVRPSVRASSRISYENLSTDDVATVDAGQVGQAIVNLCINADHAIGVKAGEIRVTLENIELVRADGAEGTRITGDDGAAAPLRAVRGILAPGPYARVSVGDNGEGMTREVLARIFDPFFTTKEVGKGTGLGLAAIDGIMQGHGGAVEVRTQKFKGTTFALLFPLGRDEPPGAARPAGRVSR